MRSLIIIILLILPNILFANEKYTIKALEKSSYRLTESGFVTYDLPPDSWTINVENSNYFLVLRDGKVALDIMKSDENVIVLRQPSKLSGYRIFTFFKKKS